MTGMRSWTGTTKSLGMVVATLHWRQLHKSPPLAREA
jgi:hypothetical protein